MCAWDTFGMLQIGLGNVPGWMCSYLGSKDAGGNESLDKPSCSLYH